MTLIFKICDAAEWERAAAAGEFRGSAADVADGFIHFSTADQLAGTAAKHFGGRSGLVVAAVAAEDLGALLKWEPSRGGALFPHLYGVLPTARVKWVKPLALGPDGIHRVPADAAGGGVGGEPPRRAPR